MNRRDNYWFKRKRYGYGWVPATWQGWLVIAAFIAVVLAGAWMLQGTPENTVTKELGLYSLFVLLAAVLLIRISARKGPSPKWRWGKKDRDDSREDF